MSDKRVDGEFTTDYMKLVVDAFVKDGHEVDFLTPYSEEKGMGRVYRVGRDVEPTGLDESMTIHVFKGGKETAYGCSDGVWDIFREGELRA